jgi:hypothetical protein
VVDCKKNHGFDKLSLDNGSLYGDDRLTGEYGSTLGDCPYIAGKLKVTQIFNEVLVKALSSEKLKVLLSEAEILKVVDKLTKTRHNCKAAVIGYLSEEHIKISYSIFEAVGEIAVSH